jgi:hypothetical protein
MLVSGNGLSPRDSNRVTPNNATIPVNTNHTAASAAEAVPLLMKNEAIAKTAASGCRNTARRYKPKRVVCAPGASDNPNGTITRNAKKTTR